jgi:hypothetical protein
MFIAELFESYIAEAGPQLVVLYPGRFQPFHLGHGEVFRDLQSKFGRDNVYIATSNKTEIPKSPFNFSDKSIFMHAAGIPSDRILEVVSPYKLPAQFDPANTIFIAAVGAPDAQRLAPDSIKKDGTEGYFKTFKSLKECATADKHGYVFVENERNKVITINGKAVDVSHGTPSREAWNAVRNDPTGRSEYLMQMYGRDDPELGRVLDKIPQSVTEDVVDTVKQGVGKAWNQVTGALGSLGKGVSAEELRKDYDKQQNNPKPEDPKVTDSTPNAKVWKEEAAGVGVVKNSKDPRYSMATMGNDNDVTAATLPKMMKGYRLTERYNKLREELEQVKEKWSAKYKKSINCSNPKGFSQRAHCQGRKKHGGV